jgi:hypothetical protein
MNYQIVKDEEKLREFIDWLPTLAPSECFLVSLFSRKKYFPLEQQREIKGDKSQLKRFTTNKEFLFNKIKQLEVAVGTYVTNDVVTPESTLALYITVNPRSYIKAAKENLKQLMDLFTMTEYNGYNSHKVALNAVQVSCSRKVYFDLDFDGVDYPTTLEQVKQLVNPEALSVIVTRGGFHLLVEVQKVAPEYVKTWYQAITKLPGCDVQGDILLPVPGCVQGGFQPQLITNP